jgi:hypothetical protein
LTSQLDLFADLAPPPAAKIHYPTYWECLGRLPEVGDYVSSNTIFLTGGPGLVINGVPYEGEHLYLFGECVRVTERVGEDSWVGVVDMGYVWGCFWGKNGWIVQFTADEVGLTDRRPNPNPSPVANYFTALDLEAAR